MIYWAVKSPTGKIIGESMALKKKYAWIKFKKHHGYLFTRVWEQRGFEVVEVILVEKPDDEYSVPSDLPVPHEPFGSAE